MRHISNSHDDDTPGHDRPWVYFMVDCFFLITEFFILTFKFKTEDFVLPGKLPPGAHDPDPRYVIPAEIVKLGVDSSNPAQPYSFMNQRLTHDEVKALLTRAAASGKGVQVRVEYTAGTTWAPVAQIFNECQHVKIQDCGLIPLRP
jgi:biopolymer transport protein ExbD